MGEYVEGEGGPNDVQTNGNISPKLTLTDVNIYDNGRIVVLGKNSELNIVSTADLDDQDYTYIGYNDRFFIKDGTVNFKGNNIDLANYTILEDGTINNTSNLFFKDNTMYICGESVFNNSNVLNNSGGMFVYDKSVFNNSSMLNNNGGMLIYNNGVFNNKGTMINTDYLYLGVNIKGRRAQGFNALSYIDMEEEEYHPVYNNDGDLKNKGRIEVDYNAIFNNNKYIENNNSISVFDGGTFNNNGDIDNNGGIFVYGLFENKGNINADKEEYLYIGKNSGPTLEPNLPNLPVVVTAQKAPSKSSEVYDEEDELAQFAIFNNDGNLVYDYGLIDYNGILNNNGTIISNGSRDDKFVTIYGELNNKNKVDAKYLLLGHGQITGGAALYDGRLKSSKISKAADPEFEPVPHWTPILKNYGTVNVSEGIGSNDCFALIYNEGTINLGGEYNTDFTGTLSVNGGVINLLKDSKYFNDAMSHYYINGTLNLVNETIDDINMNNLYLKGTNDLKLDVKLEEIEGDYLNVNDVETYNEDQYENENGRKAASVSSSDGGRFLINQIKIMTDTERKRTEIPIANITPQEYINLGVHRVFGLYEYKVIITSETSSDSDPQLEKASSDPTVGDGTAGYDQDYDEEENLDEEGSEYGNTLVFIRKDNKPRNPEILQSKVAIAGANISQDEIFTTVFNNAGNYTFFQKQGTSAGDVEDRAAPTLWIKAFGSKEDVDLEEYTTVETTYYGAVVGLDWDRQYSDNFDATYGVFASYIGGELKDKEFGNKVDQNGGYIGVRGNWYIGKLFFNGIIDYALIQNGADTTSYSVDFNSQVAGLAARVGYNFEVANKSFTIQPNFAMTGKYIMTDDYDAEDPIEGDKKKMEIDNITNLTFEPGLKLIKNLGRCWILTGEGKYVIENVSGDVKYNSQVLPDTSYDNFGSVSLGIEKIWGYTVLHLKGSKTFGGRDGYILNAGVEFKF